MVKQFKGIVKVSDVQAEFDSLVKNINNIVDIYNASDYVQHIDYNEVSPELAPLGYTLSVGGLKKILEAYNGSLIGCKVFNVENKLVITDGLLITNQGGIKLPASTIDNKGNYLHYSKALNKYISSNNVSEPDYMLICKLNTNRNLKLCNTQDFIVGDVKGFKIASQYKNIGWRTPEWLDTSHEPMFISGVEGDQKERTGRAHTILCGEVVAWNQQTGHRNSCCWVNYNKMLIPKKVPNPYRYEGGARTDMTKVYKVIEKRDKK